MTDDLVKPMLLVVFGSAVTTTALVEAAALDAQWFKDVLYSRMYLPLDLKSIKDNITHPLYPKRAAIESSLATVKASLDVTFTGQKMNFISFSCQRNMPQCTAFTTGGDTVCAWEGEGGWPCGKGDTTSCISQCLKVSKTVKAFQTTCENMWNNTVSLNPLQNSFADMGDGKGNVPTADGSNQVLNRILNTEP